MQVLIFNLGAIRQHLPLSTSSHFMLKFLNRMSFHLLMFNTFQRIKNGFSS